jgi:hypothetical protein
MQHPPRDKRYAEAAGAVAVLGLIATLIAVAVRHFLAPILDHFR